MMSLPINVINLICEFAAQDDVEWYPFISPKTGIMSWRVNRFSKKWNKNSEIILHKNLSILEGESELHFYKSYQNYGEMYIINHSYKATFIQEQEFIKMFLYIEEDVNNVFRTTLNFINNQDNSYLYSKKTEYMYMNKTIYAEVTDVYYNKITNHIRLVLELF